MKWMVCAIVMLTLTVSMVGCGGGGGATKAPATTPKAGEETKAETPPAENKPEEPAK